MASRVREGPSEVLEMFYVLIGIMVSWAYTYVKIHQVADLIFVHLTLSLFYHNLKNNKNKEKQRMLGLSGAQALSPQEPQHPGRLESPRNLKGGKVYAFDELSLSLLQSTSQV